LDEGNRIVISGIKLILIVIKGHGKILSMNGVMITNQISRSLALLVTRTDCGFGLHLVLGGERIVENKLVSTIIIMWSRRRIFDSTALVHDN
jgi:hypothetical protein